MAQFPAKGLSVASGLAQPVVAPLVPRTEAAHHHVCRLGERSEAGAAGAAGSPRRTSVCSHHRAAASPRVAGAVGGAVAETLLSPSSVALSGSAFRSGGDRGPWDQLSFAPLTCLLFAASRAGTGMGIDLTPNTLVAVTPGDTVEITLDGIGSPPTGSSETGRQTGNYD